MLKPFAAVGLATLLGVSSLVFTPMTALASKAPATSAPAAAAWDASAKPPKAKKVKLTKRVTALPSKAARAPAPRK